MKLPIHKWHLVYSSKDESYSIYQGDMYISGYMELRTASHIVYQHNETIQSLYDTINKMEV